MRSTYGQFVFAVALLQCVCAAAPDDKLVTVAAHMVDGETVVGRLVAFSFADGLVIEVSPEEERSYPTRDLVRISNVEQARTRSMRRSWRRGSVFFLSGSDRAVGSIAASDDADMLRIDTIDQGELTLPLDHLLGLSIARAGGKTGVDDSRLEGTKSVDEDLIALTNGDTVRGFIVAIDPGGITIDAPSGETRIPIGLVVGARLATDDLPPAKIPHAIVRLRDGGRYTVTKLDWRGNVVRVRHRHGQETLIEAERIVRVDCVGGRWEWISDHKPISYQHTPMLSLGWEFRCDRNVLGGPMVIDGTRFEHGVGVHSRSSLIYDLKGEYSEFVTLMGLDDSSGPLADVTAVIRVDGQRRFERENLRAGVLVGPIRFDVSGANRIELIVRFGENGDIQDRFNWADAALVR